MRMQAILKGFAGTMSLKDSIKFLEETAPSSASNLFLDPEQEDVDNTKGIVLKLQRPRICS